MQQMNFESVIEDGYIKVPERYSGLSNKKVMVEILNGDIDHLEVAGNEREKNVKEFIRSCSGILTHTQIPSDITIKEIRKLRLDEKYGL
jgi:hypothetical protein